MFAKLDRGIVLESNYVKLLTLTRVDNFFLFKKRRILFKAFIESQFKYSPLVWMFDGRQISDKINKLHERTLRIVYKDKTFTIHYQDIQSLAIEIYKAMINLP